MDDHQSDGAQGFEIKINGNPNVVASLDVAWSVAKNTPLSRWDGPDNLEELIKKTLLVGAQNSKAILNVLSPAPSRQSSQRRKSRA